MLKWHTLFNLLHKTDKILFAKFFQPIRLLNLGSNLKSDAQRKQGSIDLLVIMHSIKQCGSLKVLKLKHECWVIPASGSWWSQLLDIMWDKLITREARRWVQTTFVPDYTSAATRCLFVALLQFGGNENISSTPDPNQDQRKLNWSSYGRIFNLNIYCFRTWDISSSSEL